jgi:uncharacterized membrane protein
LIPSTFFLQVGWANLLAVVLVLGTVLWGFKSLSAEAYIYTLGLTGLLVFMRKDVEPYSSWARHAILIYPMFIALGEWTDKVKNKWMGYLILAVTIAMLLYLTGYYIMWGWTG